MDPFLQLLISMSIPTLVVLTGILVNNSRLSDLRSDVNKDFGNMRVDMNNLRADMNRRFDEVDRRFAEMDRRFGELKELWRSELHRVEEILDARLKHLEERLPE